MPRSRIFGSAGRWLTTALPFSTKTSTDLLVYFGGQLAGSGVRQNFVGTNCLYFATSLAFRCGRQDIEDRQTTCIASNGTPISMNGEVHSGRAVTKFEIGFEPKAAQVFNPNFLQEIRKRVIVPEGCNTSRKDLLWFFTHTPKPDEVYSGVIFNPVQEQWESAVTRVESMNLLGQAAGKEKVHISTTVSSRRIDIVYDGAKRIYRAAMTSAGLLEVVAKSLPDSVLPELRDALGIKFSRPDTDDPAHFDPDPDPQSVK